jgi:hypothetical protein
LEGIDGQHVLITGSVTSAAIIGLDPAKSVSEVNDADINGKVVATKWLQPDALLVFFAQLAPCISVLPILSRNVNESDRDDDEATIASAAELICKDLVLFQRICMTIATSL